MIYWEPEAVPPSPPPQVLSPVPTPVVDSLPPIVEGIIRRSVPRESKSHVMAVGFSSGASVLEVEFDDGVSYQYYGVPAALVDLLWESGRIGSFLAKNVYRKFVQRKLPAGYGQVTSTRALGASLE